MKNTNNIIAGFFLVVLGLLFLLRNFGLINFEVADIFRLWPIALIYAGVEMLPVEGKTKVYLQSGVILLFFITLLSLPYLHG